MPSRLPPPQPGARGEAATRHAFAFPPLVGEHDGGDLGLLDPADEDEAFLHVQAWTSAGNFTRTSGASVIASLPTKYGL